MQIATFLMHSTVLFMKFHSYFDYNYVFGRDQADLTISNFWDYLLIPTLIYQTDYPRTPRIRKSFIFDRCLGIIVILALIYANIDKFILPNITGAGKLSYIDLVIAFSLPLCMNTILMFFLVFEYLLNLFAELTRFADRHFYDDWWNSLDYAEFARKWNVPVHRFLQHHVYLACREKHGWSKSMAAFWTFLFSSLLHELIISLTFKKASAWFFCCQMLQVPLIWCSSRVNLRSFPRVANILFWLSIYLGMSLLFTIYISCLT